MTVEHATVSIHRREINSSTHFIVHLAMTWAWSVLEFENVECRHTCALAIAMTSYDQAEVG